MKAVATSDFTRADGVTFPGGEKRMLDGGERKKAEVKGNVVKVMRCYEVPTVSLSSESHRNGPSQNCLA